MKNRQLEILIHLLKYKKTTYNALASRFGVSSKTIERDIDRLSSAGIPVYCQQGVGGGVYIDENYTFSTSFFTPEEIYHMVTALHIAQTFTENPNNQSILHKLSLIAPHITAMFEENVQEYLDLDLYDAPVNFNQGIFVSINQCMDFKRYAHIDDRTHVACLGYVYKADGIYLFAHCGDYILLKIDQIQSFSCTETCYTEPFLTYKAYQKIRG